MGKHTSTDNDEFDLAFHTAKSFHKNHSKHVASLFLISIMLSSVSLFAPYDVYATGVISSITTDPTLLVMPPTSSQIIDVTVTRDANWPTHNTFDLSIGSNAAGVTFTTTGVPSAAQNIQETVIFDNQADTTASFDLEVHSTAAPFGDYHIFLDAIQVNTGDVNIDFYSDLPLTIGDSGTPVINLSPPDGKSGDTITVNGFNFVENDVPTLDFTTYINTTNLVVTWTDNPVPANGQLSGTFVIPNWSPDGNHEIKVTAGSKKPTTFLNIFSGGGGGFTVTASPATLNLSPPPDTVVADIEEELEIGHSTFGGFSASVNYTISGMPPGMAAYWTSDDWVTNSTFAALAPVNADPTQDIEVRFTTTDATPFGDYAISIIGWDQTPGISVLNHTQQTMLSIPPPLAGTGETVQGTLSLSPENAQVGDTVTFSGNIGALFSSAKDITMKISGSSLPTSPTSISAPVSSSGSTTFSGSFVVPFVSGALDIEATLLDDNSPQNTITLKKTLSVLSGTETYTASMSPGNLPPISPSSTSDTVTMTVNGISGKPGATFDTMVSGLPFGVGVIFPDESSSVKPSGLSDEFTVSSGGTISKTFQLKAESYAYPGPIFATVDVCDTATWVCEYFTLNS
ncbi:MAG: hypothetical protein HOG69_05055, partial [Thaumarchaeota archaeon]|nr:hypothetical protein [Nitrososphaerota archaeon]